MGKTWQRLLSAALALSMTSTLVGAEDTSNVLTINHRTYTMIGEDWGPAVSQVTLSLDQAIDPKSVSVEDFNVLEHKLAINPGAFTDPSQPFGTPQDFQRTVSGVEVSDDGLEMTLTLTVSPEEGNPFYYDIPTGFNQYADPYELVIGLNEGESITSLNTQETITEIKMSKESHFKHDYHFRNITLQDHENNIYQAGVYDHECLKADGVRNPLVVWLHGAGEGGNKGLNDASIIYFGNEVVSMESDAFQNALGGAYVLTPQAPTMWMDDGEGNYQSGDKGSMYTTALKEMIDDYIASNDDVDPEKVIIGGCSNGGYMTMEMIMTYPEAFAAAFPICEAFKDEFITDEQIEAIKDIPMWFTYAKNDGTVKPELHSIPTIERLKAAGASDLHVSAFDRVEDTSGRFKDDEGNPYEYNGHWSWVYWHNNECFDGSLSGWEWLGQVVNPDVVETVEGILHSTITDAGEAIDRLTFTLPQGYTIEGLGVDTISVHAQAEVMIGAAAGNEYFNKDRTIEKITQEGQTISVYMNRNDGAQATLTWLGEGRNYPAKLDYTVTFAEDVIIKNKDGKTMTLALDVDETKIENEEVAKFTAVDDRINYQFYHAGKDAKNLIVWFHGNGEGDLLESENNVSQLLANRGTVAWATNEAQEIFGKSHVVAFQAPTTWYDAQSKDYLEIVKEEIDAIVKNYAIDPNNLIVSGCSAGGYMATRMLIAYPNLFTSAMINCPALDVASARGGLTPTDEELAAIAKSHTAIWLVQGETDSSVHTKDCATRMFNVLTSTYKDDELDTSTHVQEFNGDFTTYETTDGKYKLSLYETVDLGNKTDSLGHERPMGKIIVQTDHNQDGKPEQSKYSDHWTWIYTLTNNPKDKDGTPMWQWASQWLNGTHPEKEDGTIHQSTTPPTTGDTTCTISYVMLGFAALGAMVSLGTAKKKNDLKK